MGTEKRTTGEVLALIVAVGITFVLGLIVYDIFLDWAVERYERSHDMGTCIRQGWFGKEYEVYCQADSSNLSWSTYIFTVWFPFLIYLPASAIIGRGAVDLCNLLTAWLAETLGVDGDEFEISPPADVIAGSLWPLVLIIVPLQLLGLLIAKAYRVWF